MAITLFGATNNVTVVGTVTVAIGSPLGQAAMAASIPVVLASNDPRFPAAAALADTTANPTLSAIQTYLMVWNGTTWDRVTDKSVTGAIDVNLSTALSDATDSIRSSKQGALTDGSGSITAGGTAQQMFAANSARRYLLIVNTDDTATGEILWVNFGTPAVRSQPSIPIAAGGSFVMESSAISTELVSVIATTTGHTWTAKSM